MKFLFLLILFSTTSFGANKYHYDSEKGKCVDDSGIDGLNSADPDRLFKDKKEGNTYPDVNAECTDFQGFDFNYFISFGDPHLVRWNIKGSNFRGAKMHFASIINSSFEGASLSEFVIGYSTLTGTVDKNTKLPPGCTPKDDKIKCKK